MNDETCVAEEKGPGWFIVKRGEKYAFRKIRFSKNSRYDVRKCDLYIFNESINFVSLNPLIIGYRSKKHHVGYRTMAIYGTIGVKSVRKFWKSE